MAEPKTRPNDADVAAFIASVPDERRRDDAEQVGRLLAEVTGAAPQMWGDSIVGYGRTHYTGAGGKRVEWFPVGFSPRKQQTVLYLLGGLEGQQDLLDRLGRHTTGRGCLYLPRLAEVDREVLAELVRRAWSAAPPAG